MSKRPLTYLDIPLSEKIRKDTIRTFLKPSIYGIHPRQLFDRAKEGKTRVQGSGRRIINRIYGKIKGNKGPDKIF